MAKKKLKEAGIQKKQVFNVRWIYLILALVTLGIYANTLSHDYVLDDAIVITENKFTQKGIYGLKDIFTHDSFYGFFQEEGKDKLVSGGRYRPLSLAMFAMEHGIFGTAPWIGHLLNIFWYFLVVCSLFFVASTLGQNMPGKKAGVLYAGIFTLLFAVHPVHTEVVANIKGRDEILALLGGVWCLYFSMVYIDTRRLTFALVAGFMMLAGLLAKENAIAFIGVIPLTVFFFKSKNRNDQLYSVMPALAATVVYLAIRFSVLGFDLGGDPPRELMNNPFLKLVDGRYEYMNFHEKYPMIIYGLFKYLQLLFFPHPLTHDYYPKFISDLHWSSGVVIVSVITIASLLSISLLKWKQWKIVSYSIWFFGMTIFLTSNLVFPVGTHLSERFLFMPSVAHALVVASLIWWIRQRYGNRSGWLTLVVVALPFMVKTIDRNQVWKNNYRLFTTDVITSDRSAKAQNAAGGEMITHALTQPDTALRHQQMRQAIGHLHRALEIHPGYKNAYLLLGNAEYYLRHFERSISYYDQALRLDPNYSEALYNRAVAQRDLGRYHGESLGDLDGAIEFLEKAHTHLQDDYETNRLLGIAYGNRNEPGKAIPFFKKALALKTDDAWTNYNLGLAYLAIRDSINANHYLGIAKTLNPEVGK